VIGVNGRDVQAQAAHAAAEARQVLASRIALLAPKVEDDAGARTIVSLAEAYAHLAIEPPRVRAG
jgi:hypothetical protein